MKRIISMLVCCLVLVGAQAQKTMVRNNRLTCEYNDVSLSEALRQLSEQTEDYTISFLYNELEDFRITTTIHRKTVPEAIRQMIGFYPIRMTVEPSIVNPRQQEIVVECPQKTASRYKGTIIDEQGQPIAYANIALLSPQDSTLITGGVSNESGLFVIPCDQQPVLARISFVGYETALVVLDARNAGSIRLKPETIMLNGVKVTGERILSKAENGHLTYNMPMLLELYPADNAYEALTRIPGVIDMGEGLTFCGQTVTLIINGKATTLSADKVVERLKQMPPDMLAKAEVMPSAPAKYHVRGMAINIVTKDFTGTNQLSGQNMWGWQQDRYGKGYWMPSIIYNHGKLSMDLSYTYTNGSGYGQVEHEARHPLDGQRMAYEDKTRNRSEGIDHEYRIGMDYAISEDHRLGLAYTGQWNSTRSTNITTGTAQSTQHSRQHTYLHNVDANYAAPPPPIQSDWSSFLSTYGGLDCPIPREPFFIDRARRAYCALVTQIDFELNRLFTELLDLKLLDNTVILFLSDHGDMLYDHGVVRKSLPFEASAGIPLIIRLPRTLGFHGAGTVDERTVELRDIFPTVCAMAGLPIPEGLDGLNLMDNTACRDYLHGEHTAGALSNQWLTDGKEKYCWFSQSGRELLFDLASDPQELHDLAAECPNRIALWRNRLAAELTNRPEGYVVDGNLQIGCRPMSSLPWAGRGC